MPQGKADRKKAKRKERLKERRQRSARAGQLEKADFLFWEALQNEEQGNLEKALHQMEKAANAHPKNEEYTNEMGRLAHALGRKDIELKALLRLHDMEALDLQGTLSLCSLLTNACRYAQALSLIDDTLRFLPHGRAKHKKVLLKSFQQQKLYCEAMIEMEEKRAAPLPEPDETTPKVVSSERVVQARAAISLPPPEIQVRVEVDPLPLRQALTEGGHSSYEDYELALEGYRIRFSEAFENLICLGQLQEVRSFWYQEETVRKVMKIFRGRALLADEVGLGKTIEALMILKEYILRGMVKSALILVPSPLVSQWTEELATKFRLHFFSTEETAFRSGETSFWNQPYVLASINTAKSPKNFPLVTQREWDLVIVDEAHHLKNRNTRALAKIGIPPRFAQTVKVESPDSEKALYATISSLVRTINKADGAARRLLLKNLLEEAGSSPRAVALSLSRILERTDGLSHCEKEIRDAFDRCCSLEDHSKHRILLNLVKRSRDKMIVFVKYLGTLESVAEFLDRQQIPYALFHGRMDSLEKEEQVRRFKEDKGILVTTEIGGEGRNLQFCNQMVNYDLPWNPMRIEQRIGRIHRIGQEREVVIYNLCAEGTIEEKILDILDRKINMFEMVIGEIDMVLGRITGEQEFSDMIYDIWVNAPTEDKLEKSFSQLATKLKRAKTGYESTKALDEKIFGENYEL